MRYAAFILGIVLTGVLLVTFFVVTVINPSPEVAGQLLWITVAVCVGMAFTLDIEWLSLLSYGAAGFLSYRAQAISLDFNVVLMLTGGLLFLNLWRLLWPRLRDTFEG